MATSDRGRLTLGDVVLLGATFVMCGPLIYAFLDLLDKRAPMLGTGEAYILQLLVPVFLLVMAFVVWATATLGVGR